jgi:hypothetical protein
MTAVPIVIVLWFEFLYWILYYRCSIISISSSYRVQYYSFEQLAIIKTMQIYFHTVAIHSYHSCNQLYITCCVSPMLQSDYACLFSLIATTIWSCNSFPYVCKSFPEIQLIFSWLQQSQMYIFANRCLRLQSASSRRNQISEVAIVFPMLQLALWC